MKAARRHVFLTAAAIAAALVAFRPVGAGSAHGNGTVQWAGPAAATGGQHAVRVYGTERLTSVPFVHQIVGA